jgi:tungstate transport system ATP-binding protein
MSGIPPDALRAPCFELHGAQVRLGAGRAPALDQVNLRILPGERVALIGANGSGKSTLLRGLHGLLPFSEGRLVAARDQRLAMLFQRPHMLRIKALHNVALGLWLQGRRWREARALAFTALQRVGLADLAQRNGRALSGGQQQRLALARAWALQPHVWLLDEPTASLDPHAKREVEQLIAEFTAAQVDGRPTTLVFASHNLGQVKRLASRVVYLEQGRVLADLPVHDFFNPELLQALCPHAHLFVQGESW